MKTGKILKCLYCGKEVYVPKNRFETFRYCSWKCLAMASMQRGTAVPIIDKWGYPITSDRLRTRTLYKGRYVTVGTASHVTLLNVCDDPTVTTTAVAGTDGE